MESRVDDLLLQIAKGQHGLCARSDLLGLGMRPSAIQRRVDRGSLIIAHRGIYLVPSLASPLTEFQLASLLVPTGALSRRTAASLHGLKLPPRDRIDLAAPLDVHRPRLENLSIHRTMHLPADDITQVHGIQTTTVARTICDLAASLSFAQLRFVTERSLLDRRCTVDQLAACRSAFVRRGRGGSAKLNLLVDGLLERDGPAAKALERLLRSVLERGRIRGFTEQFQTEWYDGRRGIVDFAHAEARIILEADSRRWHATTQAMAEDRRRDRLAQQHGWIVLRFTWHELQERPDAVAHEIAALITARSDATLES